MQRLSDSSSGSRVGQVNIHKYEKFCCTSLQCPNSFGTLEELDKQLNERWVDKEKTNEIMPSAFFRKYKFERICSIPYTKKPIGLF